jgi:hypothetical protein
MAAAGCSGFAADLGRRLLPRAGDEASACCRDSGKPTGRHADAKPNERRIVADSAWFRFEQALAGTIRIGGERCLFGRS